MSKINLLALASAALALGALFVVLHAGHPLQYHLITADALYLPVLFEDLLRRGGSVADWYLTPAPYFFPDFPLYLLAWLGGPVAAQTTIFALLQTVLMGGAVYLVARKALGKAALLAAAALACLFIWLGLHADDPFVRLYASAHHYGAFIASLVLAALWLGLDSGQPGRHGRSMMTATIALVFLTTLSDALFLVQSVLPLLATALLCRRGAAPATAPRRASLLLLLPAFIGMFSYRFVVSHPTRYKSRLSLSQLPSNLEELGRILATLFGGRPLLAAVLLLSLLAGVACIVACLRKRAPASVPRPLLLLMVFATLSCAATVAAMVLAKNVQPVPRYLIAALSWPLVAGLLLLAHRLGAWFRYAGLGLAFGVAGLLVADAWQVRHIDDTGKIFYDEQLACIDRALASGGARHGIAQYWDAKRIQGLSRRDLTVAQYTGGLTPMEWITSQRFYGAGYDFAIIADREAAEFRLPRAPLTALNGEPLQSVTCGDRSVLLFGPGRLRIPPPLQESASHQAAR